MTDIIYKCRDYIIVYKPAGVPSQSDPSGDKDAMTMASEQLSELGECDELYLIHRLDRVVGGLLVFARNKQTAAKLSRLVSEEKLGKEYLAVVDGVLDCSGDMRDYLYKDARTNKAFIVDRQRAGVKEAVLEYNLLKTVYVNELPKSLVRVRLKTGRFHQIRAQFSHRSMPLIGDGKYGSRDKMARTPALFAYKLDIDLKGNRAQVTKLPDLTEYPWCLFEEECYKS